MPTLLLVEENEAVRTLLRRVLTTHYQVLEATDGGEALRISGTHAGAIDLLLTDALLPDMTANQLVRQLATARPALKVVCMSGYTPDRLQDHGVVLDEFVFLAKPFSLAELLRTMRTELRG